MHSDVKRVPFTAESTTKLSEILSSARKEERLPVPSNQISARSYPELYQKAFHRLNQLARDKAQLEGSLRNEVTTSEEQKAYIEVLKQALEARMEDLGMKDSVGLDHFEALSTLKSDNDFSKREVLKLRHDLKNAQDTVLKHRMTIDDLRHQAHVLNEEKSRAFKEREQAIKAVEDADFTLKNLEDEKNALLDYVEETSLQQLKDQLYSLQEERDELIQTSAEIEAKNNELEDLVARQEADYEELTRAFEEIQQEVSRLTEVESQLQAAKSELEQLKSDLNQEQNAKGFSEIASEGLRSQVKEQAEHIKYLTSELKRHEDNETRSNSVISTLTQRLEETSTANKSMLSTIKDKESLLGELQKACAELDTSRSDNGFQLERTLTQLKEKTEQVETLTKSVNQFREALSNEKTESAALFDEVLDSRKKVKALNEELSDRGNEISRLETCLEEVKRDLSAAQQTACVSAEETIKAYNERLASVTSAHSSLLQDNFSLRRENAEMKAKAAEAENLANTIDDLNEALRSISNDKAKLTEKLMELNEVNHFVNEGNQLVKLLAERPLPAKTAMLLDRWKNRSIRGQEYIEWMRLLSEEVLDNEESLRHFKEAAEGLRSELSQSNLRSSERERILKQELKAVEKERDYLSSTKENCSKRLEASNSEVAHLKTQMNALRVELDSFMIQKPRFVGESDKLHCLALEEQVKRLQARRHNLENIQTESETASSELIKACSELSRLWGELGELDNERDHLRAAIRACEISLRAEDRIDGEVYASKLRDLEAWREIKRRQKLEAEKEVVSLTKRVHRDKL